MVLKRHSLNWKIEGFWEILQNFDNSLIDFDLLPRLAQKIRFFKEGTKIWQNSSFSD